jgi:BirA family biotin operon repressor/biotin-[acetyl-CoA-carboxylase] ligase
VLCRDRKVAGILCETRWKDSVPAWTAVGIGVNVHGPIPRAVAASAVALDEVTPVSRPAVLERLLPKLHRLPYTDWLSDQERDAWRARDWLAGRTLREPLAGVARGIAANGALQVETAAGMERALAGHVILA